MAGPYYDPDPQTPEQELYASAAAHRLQRLAPAPDPEPADYAERAEAAEFIIYTYLNSTKGGLLTSKSVAGISKSFASWSEVKSAVRDAMGSYFSGSSLRVLDSERA